MTIQLSFSPQRRDEVLQISATGDTLRLNGTVLDFGQLPEGATLPRGAIDCPWIAGDVHRNDGVLHVHVLLPLAAGASEAARFPSPIVVMQDGLVELPQ